MRRIGFRAEFLAKLLILFGVMGSLIAPEPARATAHSIDWADLGIADEAAVPSGSMVTDSSGFIDVTITWSVTTVGPGSFVPHSGADFLSFEADLFGGATDNLQMGFNNAENDEEDFVTVVLTYSEAVTQLQFDVLDIDSASWDDGIEIFYNGSNNVFGDPSVTVTLGSAVIADDETYMIGWEGNSAGNVPNASTDGNIVLDFGSNVITSISIRYLGTDDADANPDGQRIAFSSQTFDVPIDHGDLPDTGAGTGTGNYETLRANGGPRHLLDGYNATARTTPLMLGSTADDEVDGQPNVAADGDDTADFDDEDGVSAFPGLDPSYTSYTIPAGNITTVNSTGSAATLYGFLDFNMDGDFLDAGESTTAAVPDGATNPSSDLTWAGFATPLSLGTTYARFRLSTDGGGDGRRWQHRHGDRHGDGDDHGCAADDCGDEDGLADHGAGTGRERGLYGDGGEHLV